MNLVDLHEYKRNPQATPEPEKFDTLKELVEHTVDTDRIFPKGKPSQDSLLQWLLREIFNSYHGYRGKEKKKKKKNTSS